MQSTHDGLALIKRGHFRIIAGALVASTLLLAACGSDEQGSSSTQAATSATSATTGTTDTSDTSATTDTTETSATSATTDTSATTETSGQAASGDPVVVGYANAEGGPVSVPELRIGAEQALAYVNEELGGIKGRPLEFVRCDVDGSPETSIDCANKFVEAGVVAVVQGFDLGGEASLPVLRAAGLPLVALVAASPTMNAATDIARALGASTRAITAGILKNAADQGLKKLDMFFADAPANHEYDEIQVQPLAKQLGIEVKGIYFDPANADWNVLMTTALLDHPDLVGPIGGQESDCIGIVQAARAAGYTGTVFAGSCNGFVSALGEQAVGVQTYSDFWKPDASADGVPAPKQQELKDYIGRMTESGHEDLIPGYAAMSFSEVVTFARILNASDATDLTKASVLKAVMSADSVDGFMRGALDCVNIWKDDIACGHAILIYEVAEGGSRKVASDGFIDLTAFAPGD